MSVKKIFVKDLVGLPGAVSMALIANQAKKTKYSAQVTSGVDVLDVYGDDGKIKVFADAGAAAKFVGRFMEQGSELTITMSADAIAPKPVASSDPAKEIIKQQTALNKDITRANANLLKYQAAVASGTSLGWATGNSAEQAKLAEDTAIVSLLTAYLVDLHAKLTSLTPIPAPVVPKP